MDATTPTPAPAAMAKNSSSSLQSNHSSQSNDSQKSSSSFGSLSCITVRKEDPTAKAGIQMEQDSNGQVTVTNIASNGLFAKTDLAIGDIVLAVNKKRLGQGEGPEVLMNIVHKYATISIAVKKSAPTGAPLKKPKEPKEDGLSLLSGSTHHHKMKPRRAPRDNNNFKADTYYGGMAKHNTDGSLKLQQMNDPEDEKKPTKNLTVSATKSQPSGCDPTRTEMGNKSFGSILPRSRSKSPHSNRDRLDSKSSHGRPPRRNRSDGSATRKNPHSVGLELEIVDERLVVKAIRAKSIFRFTELRLGDIILSINDMSFRKFADAEYAITMMDKARLMVTLVIERSFDDCDDTTVDDDDSISSFGNVDDNDDDEDGEESDAYDGETSNAFHCSFGSYGEIIETDFRIEKYRPVTISVPKSRKSQDAGLVFKMVRTQKQGLFNPTISHMHPDAPAHPQKSPPSRAKRLTWIYVDSISHDSIFKNTSLRRGDKVVCINNTNLKDNPDPRAAYRACYDSKESIAIVVLKDDHSIYKEKGFEFDRTSSDLDWNS